MFNYLRRIMVLRSRGVGAEDIAESLEMPPARVQKILKRVGPDIDVILGLTPSETLSDCFEKLDQSREARFAKIAEMVPFYEQGAHLKDIALACGVSSATARTVMREAGAEIRSENFTPKQRREAEERDQTIVARRAEGEEIQDIANDLKVHPGTVYKVLRKARNQ